MLTRPHLKRLAPPLALAATLSSGLAVTAVMRAHDAISPLVTRAANSLDPLSLLPRQLPSGAALAVDIKQGETRHLEWALPGRENANTIPTTGLNDVNYALVHPATTLTMEIVAKPDGVMPESVVDQAYFSSAVRRLPIGDGVDATVSAPRDGLGAHRVEWVQNGFYYLLIEDRLKSPDGLSGVDLEQLVRVASSVS